MNRRILLAITLVSIMLSVSIWQGSIYYQHRLQREKYGEIREVSDNETNLHRSAGSLVSDGPSSGIGSSTIHENTYYVLIDQVNNTGVELLSVDIPVSDDTSIVFNRTLTDLPIYSSNVGLAFDGSLFWTAQQNLSISGWTIYAFDSGGEVVRTINFTSEYKGERLLEETSILIVTGKIGDVLLFATKPSIGADVTDNDFIITYDVSAQSIVEYYPVPYPVFGANMDDKMLWIKTKQFPFDNVTGHGSDQPVIKSYLGYKLSELSTIPDDAPAMTIFIEAGDEILGTYRSSLEDSVQETSIIMGTSIYSFIETFEIDLDGDEIIGLYIAETLEIRRTLELISSVSAIVGIVLVLIYILQLRKDNE